MIGVNSDGFLQCRAEGSLTPDLVVTEFRRGCGQMDLASACVLHPLNRLVLYLKMDGGQGEQAEEAATRGGVVLMVSSKYGTGCRRVT